MHIAERILSVISDTCHIPREQIHLTSELAALGVDSLGALDVVFAVENEFGITIEDQTAAGIRTVSDIVAGVERLLGSEALVCTPEAMSHV